MEQDSVAHKLGVMQASSIGYVALAAMPLAIRTGFVESTS